MPDPTKEEVSEACIKLLLKENGKQYETIEALTREYHDTQDRIARFESTVASLVMRLAQEQQSRFFEHGRARDEDDGLHEAARAMGQQDLRVAELTLLRQQVAGQRTEIEKLKAESMRAGAESVSRSWQASLDEALRREREKDALVIENLQMEVDMLRRSQGQL